MRDAYMVHASPNVYSRRIRHLAFDLLVNQVVAGKNRQLVLSLLKRPPSDAHFFTMELMSCMGEEWLCLVK
jgi:hypothetical protein